MVTYAPKSGPLNYNPFDSYDKSVTMYGYFPTSLEDCKSNTIVQENPDILDNYRPISLLSSISKTFEKVVFNQVYEYFTNNELFHNSQYGFRK